MFRPAARPLTFVSCESLKNMSLQRLISKTDPLYVTMMIDSLIKPHTTIISFFRNLCK